MGVSLLFRLAFGSRRVETFHREDGIIPYKHASLHDELSGWFDPSKRAGGMEMEFLCRSGEVCHLQPAEQTSDWPALKKMLRRLWK